MYLYRVFSIIYLTEKTNFVRSMHAKILKGNPNVNAEETCNKMFFYYTRNKKILINKRFILSTVLKSM